MRKKISKKSAADFMDKPVAKKKADRKMGEKLTAATVKKSRKSEEVVTDKKSVGGGALRGMMDETMARVYSEMFPSMSTHDQMGNVDQEIREESYILSLTMVCGNDAYLPRKGLKIREKFMGTFNFCSEHN